MTSAVWLGDLAKVLTLVRATGEDDRHLIAELLGLAPEAGPDDPRFAALPQPHLDDPVDFIVEPDPVADLAIEPETPRAASVDLPLLTPVARDPVGPIGWGSRSLPPVTEEHLTALPDHEPLLAPQSHAAVLQAIVAQRRPEGSLDVPAVVEVLARRQSVASLPRLPRQTLRFGVQILVDLGPGMQPFLRDEAELVTQIRAVVGIEATSVLYFSGCPTRRAGPGAGRTWREYQPPPTGTPLLVLSDLVLQH